MKVLKIKALKNKAFATIYLLEGYSSLDTEVFHEFSENVRYSLSKSI